MARKKKPSLEAEAARLRALALSYPDTFEEHPWGDNVVKVRKKGFVFYGAGPDRFNISLKLPHSSFVALELPFVEPTHYGMGKYGWVTAKFGPGDPVPFEMLASWLDESYRSVAPKTLVKSLPESGPPQAEAPPKKKRARRRGIGPVILTADDDGRRERAREALDTEGLAVLEADPDPEAVLGVVKRKKPSAIVIDLGRRPANGLALASSLRSTDLGDVPVVLAGIRDARTERKVQATLGDVDATSRKPPGDDEVIATIVSIATS